MLKMNEDLEGALKEYLQLLDEEEYFEAHEVLEEAWHPLRKADHPLKNLAKGLINGAIAFEHLKRDRNEAHQKAKKVMVSFDRYRHLCTGEIEYFEFFEEACQKIEVLKIKHIKVF
jgi:dsDNA-specific endonuclease/ATPase MutS2